MDGLNMKIYNWYLDNIYYPIYRFIVLTIWDKIRPGTIKHYYQRARYGYSYQDCWSIDYHLADIIPKMLRDMKKTIHGCPGDIAEKWTEKDKEDPDMIHAMNEWEMILDKIANAFELEYEIIDHKLFDYKTKKQENKMKEIMQDKDYFSDCRIMTKEEKNLRDEGWKLFRKYFYNLWD